MPLVALILLFLFAAPAFPQQDQAPPPELERVDQTLQALAELKTQVAAISAEIDQLIAGLSEQRGALQNRKPAAFGGIGLIGDASASPADRVKPKPSRCAAITVKGDRCTRSAAQGSRYCRQHLVARQR